MSTHNVTYNFNQGNMSFGNMLMYGMFGSLTGGIGCYGGGFGMGMSPFSMGGSLFNMTGMGCCGGFGGYGMGFGGYGMGFGCGMSDGQFVGMTLGALGSQLLMGALSQVLDGRGGAKEDTQTKIDNIESKADKYLDLVGCESLDDFDSNTKVSDIIKEGNKYYDDYKNKSTIYTDAKGTTADAKKALESKKLSTTVPPKREAYKDESGTVNQGAYEADLALWNAYDEAKKAEEKAKTEMEKAKRTKEAKEQEVKTAINELTSLKAEYDELVAQQKKENQIELLDQYDSSSWKRAKKSSLEKYDSETPITDAATRPEIFAALNGYKKAEKKDDQAEMNKYKRILTNIAKVPSKDLKDFKPAFESLGITIRE